MTTQQAQDSVVYSASLADVQELGILPKTGYLVPLKTKDELLASRETFDVYVVEVPAAFASAVLNVVRKAIPDLTTVNLQHLRRVVQLSFLPKQLQIQFSSAAQAWDRGSTTSQAVDGLGATIQPEIRYLLVSPTSLIALPNLLDVLAQNPPFLGSPVTPQVFTVPVPALAPTSSEQALQWSQEYWSISYKNTNPYGPHPSLVARNTAEIEPHAGTWLALAELAGEQIKEQGLGENIGCVIVDGTGKEEKVIAATGDTRWCSPDKIASLHRDGPGNVMAHAVLRAIAMVAKKRLRIANGPLESESTIVSSDSTVPHIFCDDPHTPLEHRFYLADNLTPNGYLCLDLDIYVTHEPCVMCSMAILHSRFRRCVFGRRMPLTGGLTAEIARFQESGIDEKKNLPQPSGGLGCGIFWRPSELNWKFLAWEWESDGGDEDRTGAVEDSIQA
ncbi:cytidine deaminase-like protein [Lepidopterella palustris CBS 459.81]|uniref:Cytidine deaminase-like protein n=1 Tax=Lepidopterella palustris CBS 459.81 TaxID=1314670 RepID=A0A8E2JCW2_9PEZI|nr:cytidine deaminase-like protein [Lepidopterella palustris CBS 459.81]